MTSAGNSENVKRRILNLIKDSILETNNSYMALFWLEGTFPPTFNREDRIPDKFPPRDIVKIIPHLPGQV